MVHMLTFLVGMIFLLLGVLLGGALCVSYLRREIADDIGPKLRRVQFQLDSIGAQLNLAITTRQAELSGCSPRKPGRRLPVPARWINLPGTGQAQGRRGRDDHGTSLREGSLCRQLRAGNDRSDAGCRERTFEAWFTLRCARGPMQ